SPRAPALPERGDDREPHLLSAPRLSRGRPARRGRLSPCLLLEEARGRVTGESRVPTLAAHGETDWREADRRQPARAARVPPRGPRRGRRRAQWHGGEVAARRAGHAAARVRRGA